MLDARPVITDDYNLYLKGSKTVSCASGIELPDLKPKTAPVDGAGVLGEYNEPATGQYEDFVMKIPFTHLSAEACSLLDTLNPPEITIRAVQQGVTNPGTSVVKGLRVVARGKCTNFTPGKLEKGAKSDTELELSLLYYKIEIDGETMFEIDKLNYICVINSNDVMAQVRPLL